MSYSNSFEGGLNTIMRVFPAATTGGLAFGKMPKNGKIVRVRYSGRVAETGVTVVMSLSDLNGLNLAAITTSTALEFANAATAHIGVDADLINQAARDAKDGQYLDLTFTGSIAGDIIVEVAFEPR